METSNGVTSCMESNKIRSLMDVALGHAPADRVVFNAKVLNVFTGELLKDHAVCIKGGRIACVGKDIEAAIGDRTHVIDADGQILVPGFIDAHAHLAWSYSPEEFLKYAMTGGTTTIVTETFEAYFTAGYEGVIDFLSAVADQPIKIFATAPAMVSTSKGASGIKMTDLMALLEREDIVGLGEAYWQGVLQAPESFLPTFCATRRAKKTLEGHTAGASEKKLAAYVAAGISSCHEPIRADEALSRLRQGLYVMVREGSIRRDLAEVSKIVELGIDLRRMVLATDGISPDDLRGTGYMESVVQKAIECGFDPTTAIRMATLNPAVHFGLDSAIGAIAPGHFADLLLIPDLKTITPSCVISNGEILSQDGRLLIPPRPHVFSEKSRKSIHLPRPMTPDDFRIHAPNKTRKQPVRIIDMVTDLVTKEHIESLPVIEGEIRTDLQRDIIKTAAIDRHLNPGKCFVGLIRGFKMFAGAMASSGAWDTGDIIVVGTDEADMADAVNRLAEIQGGMVVVKDGEVLAEQSLPIFGIITDEPMKTILDNSRVLKSEIKKLGVEFTDPLLTLVTLTGAAIPFLRICEEGLVDLKTGRRLSLFPET